MKVPLIMLVWNKPSITKDCIESLEKYTEPGFLDIIICDNGSTQPGMPEYLKELEKKYTVLYNKANLVHKGWFQGLKQAKDKYGEILNYFALSDPDIVLPESMPRDWPEVMVKFLETHKEVAKVGVMLDVAITDDEDIQNTYHGMTHGIYKTDVVYDPCYRKLMSTTLSMWRWDTFGNIFESKINESGYNPKYTVGGVVMGGRFLCRHLGWEMWKTKYRKDMEYYEVALKNRSGVSMNSISHLTGHPSRYNSKGTDRYKYRRED